MSRYVDGFVIPMPKKSVPAYKKIAKKAGKIWLEHGALQYVECIGDDLINSFGLPFPKLTKLKPTETVAFSWIVYKSKSHRDQVNKKVMADPRLAKMGPELMPFDVKKMSYGGFKTMVDL